MYRFVTAWHRLRRDDQQYNNNYYHNNQQQHATVRCRVAVTLLFVGCWVSAAVAQPTLPTQPAPLLGNTFYASYAPQLIVGAYGASDAPSIVGEGALWLPLYQTRTNTWFTQLSGYKGEQASYLANVATGYRSLVDPDTLMSIHGSVDTLESQHHFTYEEGVIGTDLWTHGWYLGANAYLPMSTGYHALGQGYEGILPGTQGEVGITLFHHINVFAGGYYYYRSDFKVVMGPKLEVALNHYFPHHAISRLQLVANVRDDTRGTTIWGGIQLSLGMLNTGTQALPGMAIHMTDAIRRDPPVISTDYRS